MDCWGQSRYRASSCTVESIRPAERSQHARPGIIGQEARLDMEGKVASVRWQATWRTWTIPIPRGGRISIELIPLSFPKASVRTIPHSRSITARHILGRIDLPVRNTLTASKKRNTRTIRLQVERGKVVLLIRVIRFIRPQLELQRPV